MMQQQQQSIVERNVTLLVSEKEKKCCVLFQILIKNPSTCVCVGAHCLLISIYNNVVTCNNQAHLYKYTSILYIFQDEPKYSKY